MIMCRFQKRINENSFLKTRQKYHSLCLCDSNSTLFRQGLENTDYLLQGSKTLPQIGVSRAWHKTVFGGEAHILPLWWV